MPEQPFARAITALRLSHGVVAQRTVPTRAGVAYLHDAVPQSHANNLMVVDDFGSVEEIAAAAEQGLASRQHRMVVAYDDAAGARLVGGLRQRGYVAEHDVVMAHRSGRPAGSPAVRLGAWEEVRPALVEDWAMTLAQPESAPVVLQLTERSRLTADALHARWYVALRGQPGGVAALAELRCGVVPGVAQVEGVVTLSKARRQGLATAVVTRAVQAAYDEGADLIFLVADCDDWPRHFYRRLGFADIGYFWQFTRQPAGE